MLRTVRHDHDRCSLKARRHQLQAFVGSRRFAQSDAVRETIIRTVATADNFDGDVGGQAAGPALSSVYVRSVVVR
jgi:hypothetical protein